VIPAQIDSLPVTSIGVSAFQSHKAITSVTLPDSVASIGNNAFDGCTNLTALPLTDYVTSIGDYAFVAAHPSQPPTFPLT
jgi:hypothetical protein